MNLAEFDFALPPELIAQKPLAERSASRLFFYDRETGQKLHLGFPEILNIFGANDVLVFNDSRVLPARIRFAKKEILLVECLEKKKNIWNCLVRPGKFFQPGRVVNFPGSTVATVESVDANGFRQISFRSHNFSEFLAQHGEMPTPPYIKEKLQNSEKYQTVYARKEGSVAAPTAGFHFTAELLQALKERGVQTEFVTLHVGPGTFLPVKSEQVENHQMHAEYFEVSEATSANLNTAKEKGKAITAVGSTALRTLESCVVKIKGANSNSRLQGKIGKTNLFLYPPAEFRFVDHFLTNFHLPKSTLLMLLAAFLSPGNTQGVGKMQELYATAISEKYRFFSFGDAMLIW